MTFLTGHCGDFACGCRRESVVCRYRTNAPPTICSQMIALIEDPIAKGHAMWAEGHGAVSCSWRCRANYGQGSRPHPCDAPMIAGARRRGRTLQKNPSDFVLWKHPRTRSRGWTVLGAWPSRAGTWVLGHEQGSISARPSTIQWRRGRSGVSAS